MSRARHKEHEKRARGGGLSSEPKWNAGGEQNAAKEAEEKKRGGHVKHHGHGEHAKHRADKRKRGGHVKRHEEHEERKHGGHVKHHEEHEEERRHGGGVHHHDGAHSEMVKHVKKHSMMHHGRARGGRIGSNLMPLSTAARVKHITPGEQAEEGVEDMAKSKSTIKG